MRVALLGYLPGGAEEERLRSGPFPPGEVSRGRGAAGRGRVGKFSRDPGEERKLGYSAASAFGRRRRRERGCGGDGGRGSGRRSRGLAARLAAAGASAGRAGRLTEWTARHGECKRAGGK